MPTNAQAAGLTVEFVRFPIRAGKESRALEWIAYLRGHEEEFLATLPGECMYAEAIFSDVTDGILHLSWFSVQGPGAEFVLDSDHELDRVHVDFHRECVDPDAAPLIMVPEVFVMPTRLRALLRPAVFDAAAGPVA